MPSALSFLWPPRRLHRLAAALGVAVLLAASGCSVLDSKQREWIFQPSDRSWPGANTAGMDDVWIDMPEHDGARLHGLWLPSPAADAPVLLYLHGARWNVAGSSPRIRRLNELGFSVLAIDYRGFGKSSAGLPSEESAAEDARAAWDWLGRHAPGRPRYIFGHSLGGAIAIDLARSVQDEAGVMVEATFTSIPDVVSSFRWGWLPVGPLVVHGSADPLIPAALGRQLFEAASEPKRFVLIEGGNHHNTQSRAMDQYRQALGELFGLRLLAQAPAAPASLR
jgi:alpha-beta hydrolase superfamily lysophospholipase